MKPLLPLALACGVALAAPSAHAQMLVHDASSYASLLREAQTALEQLNELKAQVGETRRLYDGFNTASGAGGLARVLASPQLRAVVPDIDAYVAAAQGDLTALGAIGRKAADIRSAQRLYAAPAEDLPGRDLERQGDRAARDLALGRAVAGAGSRRLEGLQTLADAIDTAPNARAIMDLQARLDAEQAMTLNDQMRLQGLAMAQAAEDRLQRQRHLERTRARRQDRMARYRSGFQ